MLFQVACNQFLVVKKTWPNMLILSGGAIANIAINYYLIPVLGIEGAAIATLAGYAISDIVGVLVLQKMNLLRIQPRFIAASGMMLAYILLWRLIIKDNVLVSFIVAVLVSVLMILLYRKDLTKLSASLKGKKK